MNKISPPHQIITNGESKLKRDKVIITICDPAMDYEVKTKADGLNDVELQLQCFFKCTANHCHFCSENEKRFLKHLFQKHTGTQLYCLYCDNPNDPDKLLMDANEELVKHMINAHGQRTFQCNKCVYRTRDHLLLEIHLKWMHDDQTHFDNKVHLKKEYFAGPNFVIKCDSISDEVEISEIEIRRLINLRQQKRSSAALYRWNCLYCDHSSPERNQLLFHVSKNHADQKPYCIDYGEPEGEKEGEDVDEETLKNEDCQAVEHHNHVQRQNLQQDIQKMNLQGKRQQKGNINVDRNDLIVTPKATGKASDITLTRSFGKNKKPLSVSTSTKASSSKTSSPHCGTSASKRAVEEYLNSEEQGEKRLFNTGRRCRISHLTKEAKELDEMDGGSSSLRLPPSNVLNAAMLKRQSSTLENEDINAAVTKDQLTSTAYFNNDSNKRIAKDVLIFKSIAVLPSDSSSSSSVQEKQTQNQPQCSPIASSNRSSPVGKSVQERIKESLMQPIALSENQTTNRLNQLTKKPISINCRPQNESNVAKKTFLDTTGRSIANQKPELRKANLDLQVQKNAESSQKQRRFSNGEDDSAESDKRRRKVSPSEPNKLKSIRKLVEKTYPALLNQKNRIGAHIGRNQNQDNPESSEPVVEMQLDNNISLHQKTVAKRKTVKKAPVPKRQKPSKQESDDHLNQPKPMNEHKASTEISSLKSSSSSHQLQQSDAIATVVPKYFCTFCEESNASPEKMQDHILGHLFNYECRFCAFTDESKTIVESHLKLKHSSTEILKEKENGDRNILLRWAQKFIQLQYTRSEFEPVSSSDDQSKQSTTIRNKCPLCLKAAVYCVRKPRHFTDVKDIKDHFFKHSCWAVALRDSVIFTKSGTEINDLLMSSLGRIEKNFVANNDEL